MAENKQPHYVPAAYIGRFSISNSRNKRKAKIHVFDGIRQFSGRAESFGKKSKFYGENSAEEQLVHGEIEGGLWGVLKKIDELDEGVLPPVLAAEMFFYVVYQYLRGAEFEDGTSLGRLASIQNHAVVFLQKVFLGVTGIYEFQEIFGAIINKWSCSVICAEYRTYQYELCCSDNPVQVYHKNDEPELIFFPIDRFRLFVAVYKSNFQLNAHTYNALDASKLNTSLALFSKRHIYSSLALCEEDVEAVKNILEKRVQSSSKLMDNGFSVTTYPATSELPSFMIRKPN